MSWTLIVLIVLILALAGSVPAWPYSRNWGWAPTGLLTVITILVLLKYAHVI